MCLSTSLPLCSHCHTFIWQFIFILPAPLIIGKGWMKFPFTFVLPHGHKNHRDSFVCVCLVLVFFLPLHLNCLLPVLFHSSLLDGDMYAIIIPFFFRVRVSHQASIKQSRKEGSSAVIYVSRQKRRRGGKKYEIELMCCWFMWKHKTLGDTFDDSWKYIENRNMALMLIWISLLSEALPPSGLCSL